MTARSRGDLLARTVVILLLGALPLVDCGRKEKAPGTRSPLSAAIPVAAMRDLIRERTSRFDGQGRILCGNEYLCGSLALPLFYEARDFTPAWVAGGRPTRAMDDLLAAIRDSWKSGLNPAFYRLTRIQSLVEDLRNGRGPKDPQGLVDIDMILTDSFLLLASHLASGAIDPKTIKADWFIKIRQADLPARLRDALEAGAIGESLRTLHPHHPWYTSLEDALRPAYQVYSKGGWGQVPAGPTLKKGATGPRVEALLKRLRASGDMPAVETTTDKTSPAVLNDDLVDGVKRFQARHSLESDGNVGRATIEALNVPIERRIEQIRANLERWRWIPPDFGERYILVNIASFSLDVIENGHSVLSMPVIVGRDYRETPVFGAEMTYLVLNPTWTIPPKLAIEDILHKVQEDSEYLATKEIRVFSNWTENAVEVDPATIDWSLIKVDHFPYMLRQDPSPSNSLGRIAFMLPNEYAIYLHDTPERWLFERAERTFSSGCIRLADPLALAEYLLTGEEEWNREGILDGIDKGLRLIVRLSRPIPVFLVYLTAWVDDRGITHFQRDVYGRDAALIRALAEPPPSPSSDRADVHVNKVGFGVVPHTPGF